MSYRKNNFLSFMNRKFKQWVLSILATKKFQPFFRKLHWIALKGMNYGSANSPFESGEANVLDELENELPENPIIFDVGANRGYYIDLVIKKWGNKNPNLHAFEPDSSCYEILTRKYGSYNNIIFNKCALGSESGKATLYAEQEGAVNATLVESDLNTGVLTEVDVHTIDEYCLINNITTIDFLKIDTEGFEINVLKGAKEMIRKGAIHRIQLEHGSFQSILMGASLYSYGQILKEYELFHIKQDGLFKLNVTPINEIYYNSNYFFKHKTRKR